MGNGTSQVGGDQPGVVTLPEITLVGELPKVLPTKTDEKTPPSPSGPNPDDYKKLIAKAKSLGLKLDFLDEAGNVKPEKAEEVKANVKKALDAKIKSTLAQSPGLTPDNRTVAVTLYLPYLLTETEFSLLSPEDQKAFLAASPLNKEGMATYKPTQRPPNKQMAQAIRLEGLRQETAGDVGNASRLFDTAANMDPESNFLRLQAGSMKRKWAEQEKDPIIKAHLYEEAVAHYDISLKINPDDKLAKTLKGTLLFEEGKNLKLWADKVSDPKEKKRLLTKALACSVDSLTLAEAVSASAKAKADRLTLHADLLAASGKPEEAKLFYELREQTVRDAFQENMGKLHSGKEATQAKAELEALVPYLESSLKTEGPHAKFEDLKRLKEFYAFTGNQDKLVEVVKQLQSLATELRGKHTYTYGTKSSAEQVVETRLVFEIDILLKDAEHIEKDFEVYDQFQLYAPLEVRDQTSNLPELLEIEKDISLWKDEASKLPDPPPVKNEEGYLVEQRSLKEKLKWCMRSSEINRLVEKKERERTGVKEGPLPKESNDRISVVNDLLNTLENFDGEDAQRARDRLFGSGLDSYIEKKTSADLFLSKADEIKDPQEKRAVLTHALREYVALKDDSGVRKTIDAIRATLPNLPKGPEELMERLQFEQVIQTAVKGAYPEIEAKFKKSCDSDVAVLQGMLDLGETADGKKLSAQQKYQITLTISGNSFVDADNSLNEDGFLTGSSVGDAKQTLHAKLDSFKKTKDYQSSMDRGGDGKKKDLKPTYESTQKLWSYLNEQPEYALLSFEDRKAFLKDEGYEVFGSYSPRVGDVAKSVVNDILPFEAFDTQDFSRIQADSVAPSGSASSRRAIFMARQAKRLEDKGQPEEASKVYKAALEKNPNDVNARIGYARTLLAWEKISQKVNPNPKRLGESQTEAVKQMDEILKKDPRNWEAKGARLLIVLDQKYSEDPKGKLEFVRKEFDENITLYEGLAAKDQVQGDACLGYMKLIADHFPLKFEKASNADELKDLARAYRLFKDIPKKSSEDQGIFLHYLELLDRNMRDVKDGTITFEGVDPLDLAQTIYEIDTKMRKMPDFEVAKDLIAWQQEVENCPPDALNDKDRASQYGKMLKEWMKIRDRAKSGDPTAFSNPNGYTEKNIKPLAEALKKTILQGNKSPNAAAKLDQFFERLIGSNDLALLGALTPDGLSGYIEGANQLDQSFENAKKMTGAKQRSALLGVIEQAKTLRDEKTAEAAVQLYQASVGEATPADDRLKATLELDQALKDSKFAVAGKIHDQAASEVQSTWSELESKNDPDPSTVRRLMMVADFMGKERGEDASKIAAKAKEKVKIIRAVLVNNLHGKFEEGFRPETDDQRTEMQQALKASHPLTDPRERADAAKLVADIDRALLQDSLNEAGNDAEKKEKIGSRLLTDFSRWHAEIGKVQDYSPSEKAEQLALLTQAGFSLERMGKEPNAVFRDKAFSAGITAELEVLKKEVKEFSSAQAKAAFDSAIPPESMPAADREKLWQSFEKDFSPLFDKAWEDRSKPGQESSAMIRIKSFTSPESLSQIFQDWKKADDLVKSYHDPLTKEDLESAQKAVQIFGGLGMTERVKGAMAPLITVAHNPNLPIADRVMILNMIAQLYQQGGMTTEANASLQEIIDIGDSKDTTPELKEAGILAKAFQFLNKGEVDKGEDVLASLPDNKTAKAVLESIREGRKRCRGMQLMAALRAYYDNYEAGKNEEQGIIVKTVTAGSWERKFDDAAKEDLRVNRGRLDMIEQWMVVDGYDFHQAIQMAFIDDPKAYHEFNMCLEHFSTDMNMYANNLPRDLVTRTLDPAKAKIGWLSDPLLSEADFGNGLYRFAEGLRDQGMFSAASQVATVISDNKFVGARAQALLTHSIPDAQKKDAFAKGLVMSLTGASILEAKSWGDVAWEAIMFVGPMAAGNALGSLGKGMYAARAVGVASKVEGFLLKVGINAERAAVWGTRVSEVGAWTAKSGFEALGFTVFETGAERIRHGKIIYADDFMKKWGGMMVTFGLCHATGSWAAEKGETTRWLTGVGSFLAADIVNENIGLKEKTHEDWATRFVNAVKGDLSMRVAGSLVHAASGGYFHGVETRAEERLRENQYARFAEHLGLDVSRDWKGNFKPETARVIQEAMGLCDTRGIDPRKTADVVKFQNELKEIIPRAEVDRAVKVLDPSGEHSQALRAAVFSYVISEMSKTATPEAEAKVPEKIDAASAKENQKAQASKLMAEIPVKMEPILGLKLPGEFKSAIIENVLVKGMSEGEIKALSEQLPEIGESFKAMTEKLGDKAALLLLRQAVRGAIKVEDISKHLKALTEQMETLEKILKEGLKGKGELKEAELQEAMEKLLLAALEISQAAEDPKLLEKALQALAQNFIEERNNDQKVKRALEETLQKGKERTAEIRGKKFAEEREREREKGRQGKEKEEATDEVGGVGKKKRARPAGEAEIPEKGPLTRDQAVSLARERFGLEGELTESQVKKTYKAWYSENSPEARAQRGLDPLPNYVYAERSALRDVLLRDVCKIELKTADEARVKDYLAGKITRAPREAALVREGVDRVSVDQGVRPAAEERGRAEERREEETPFQLGESRERESISAKRGEREESVPEFEVAGALPAHVEATENKSEINALSLGSDAAPAKALPKEISKESSVEKLGQVIPLASIRRYANRVLAAAAAVLGITFAARPAEAAELGTKVKRAAENLHTLFGWAAELFQASHASPLIAAGAMTTMALGFGAAALVVRETVRSEKGRREGIKKEETSDVRKVKTGEREAGGQGKEQGQGEEQNQWGTSGRYSDMEAVARKAAKDEAYKIPPIPGNPAIRDPLKMSSYFDRLTVQPIRGVNGEISFREVKLIQAPEHAGTEWQGGEPQFHFRETWHVEEKRSADQETLNSYLWWGRHLVEANRDRSTPLSPDRARSLQRQFEQGATVHAIYGKIPLRFEMVTVGERGEVRVEIVDIATFESYISHVERNVKRVSEAFKKRGEWPRVELPKEEPIDVTEHAKLIEEEPIDVSEHAHLIEEGAIPIRVETPLPRFAFEGEPEAVLRSMSRFATTLPAVELGIQNVTLNPPRTSDITEGFTMRMTVNDPLKVDSLRGHLLAMGGREAIVEIEGDGSLQVTLRDGANFKVNVEMPFLETSGAAVKVEAPLPRFPLAEEVDNTLRSMSRKAAELPAEELDIRSVTLHPPNGPGLEGEFVMKIGVGDGFASADGVRGELLTRGHEVEEDGSIRMKLEDGREVRVVVEEPLPSFPLEEKAFSPKEERIQELTEADFIVEEEVAEEKVEELTDADFIVEEEAAKASEEKWEEVLDEDFLSTEEKAPPSGLPKAEPVIEMFVPVEEFIQYLKEGAKALDAGEGRYQLISQDGQPLGFVQAEVYSRITERLGERFREIRGETLKALEESGLGQKSKKFLPMIFKELVARLMEGDPLLEHANIKLEKMAAALKGRSEEISRGGPKPERIIREILLGEKAEEGGEVIPFRKKGKPTATQSETLAAAAKGGPATDRAESSMKLPPALEKVLEGARRGVSRVWEGLLDLVQGSRDKMLAVGPVAMLPFVDHRTQIGMVAVMGMAVGVSIAKGFRRAPEASREEPVQCRVLEGDASYRLWPQFLGEVVGGQQTPLMKIAHQEIRGEEVILHLKPETDIHGQQISPIVPESLVVTLSAEEAARLPHDAKGNIRGVNYRIDPILQEGERPPDSQFRFQEYRNDVMKLFLVKMGFDGADPNLPQMATELARMSALAAITPEIFENPHELAREFGRNPALMDRLAAFASEGLRSRIDEAMGVNAEGFPGHETVEGKQLIATLLLMRVQTGKEPVAIFEELTQGMGKILSERFKISENDPLHGEWTARLLKFSIRSGITLQGDIRSILNGLELTLESLSPQFSEVLEAQGMSRGKSSEAAKKILLTLFLEKGIASDAIDRPETWANYLDGFTSLKDSLEALSRAVYRDPKFYEADVPRFKGEYFLSLLTRVGSFGELQKKLNEYGQNAPKNVQRLSARIDDAMGPNRWGQKVSETAKGLQVLAKVFSLDPGLEHLTVTDQSASFNADLLKLAEGFRDGFTRKEIWAQDLDREGMPEAGRKVSERVKKAVEEMDVLLDALVAADRVLDLQQLPRRRLQEAQRELANHVELVDRWTRYHEKRLAVQNLIENYLLPFKQTFLRIRDAERVVEEFGLPEIAALGEAQSPFPLTIEEGLTIRHSHRSPEFGADFFEDLHSTQQYEGLIHVGTEALRDLLIEECLKGEGEVFSKSLPLLKSGRDFIIRPHPEDPHALQVTSVKERTTFALRFEVASPVHEPLEIFEPTPRPAEMASAELAAAKAEKPESIRGEALKETPGILEKMAKWMGIGGVVGLASTAFMHSAEAAVQSGGVLPMGNASAMAFGAMAAVGILGAVISGRERGRASRAEEDLMGDNRKHNKQVRAIERMVEERLLEAQVEIPIDVEIQRRIHDAMVHYKENRLGRKNADVPRAAFGEIADSIATDLIGSREARAQREVIPSTPASQGVGGTISIREAATAEIDRLISEVLDHPKSPLKAADPKAQKAREKLTTQLLEGLERFLSEMPEIQSFDELNTYGFFAGKRTLIRDFIIEAKRNPSVLETLRPETSSGGLRPPPGSAIPEIRIPKDAGIPNAEFAEAEFEMGERFRALGVSWESSIPAYLRKTAAELKKSAAGPEAEILDALEQDIQKVFPERRQPGEYNPFDYEYRQAVDRLLGFVAHWKTWERTGVDSMGPMERSAFFAPLGRDYRVSLPLGEQGLPPARGRDAGISEPPLVARDGKTAKIPMDRDKKTAPIAKRETPTVRVAKESAGETPTPEPGIEGSVKPTPAPLLFSGMDIPTARTEYERRKNSAERKDLHEKIVRQLLGQGQSSDHPNLTFTAGAPGAGKSSSLEALEAAGLLESGQSVMLDSDAIKELLPEYAALKEIGDQGAANVVHAESLQVMNLVFEQALKIKKNITIDSTLRSSDYTSNVIQKIRRENPEYAVSIIFVDAEQPVLLERVASRAILSGRHVDESYVVETKGLVRASVETLRKMADASIEIDNNIRPKICSFFKHGEVVTVDLEVPLKTDQDVWVHYQIDVPIEKLGADASLSPVEQIRSLKRVIRLKSGPYLNLNSFETRLNSFSDPQNYWGTLRASDPQVLPLLKVFTKHGFETIVLDSMNDPHELFNESATFTMLLPNEQQLAKTWEDIVRKGFSDSKGSPIDLDFSIPPTQSVEEIADEYRTKMDDHLLSLRVEEREAFFHNFFMTHANREGKALHYSDLTQAGSPYKVRVLGGYSRLGYQNPQAFRSHLREQMLKDGEGTVYVVGGLSEGIGEVYRWIPEIAKELGYKKVFVDTQVDQWTVEDKGRPTRVAIAEDTAGQMVFFRGSDVAVLEMEAALERGIPVTLISDPTLAPQSQNVAKALLKLPRMAVDATAPIAAKAHEYPSLTVISEIPEPALLSELAAAAKGVQNPPSGRVEIGEGEGENRFDSLSRRAQLARAIMAQEDAGLRDLVGEVSEAQAAAAKSYLAHGENPPPDADLSFVDAGYAYNVHVEGGRRRGLLIFSEGDEGSSSTLPRWEITAVEGDHLSLRNEKGETLQLQGDAVRKKSIEHPFEVGDSVRFLPQVAGGAPTPKEVAEAESKKPAPITPTRQNTPPFGFEAFLYQRPGQADRGDYEFMVSFGGVKQEIIGGQIVRRPRWFLTVNSGMIPDLPFPRFVEVNGQRVEGMSHEILPGQKIRSWDGKEFIFEPPAVDVTPEQASPWAQGRGQPLYSLSGQAPESVSPWAVAAKGIETPPGGRAEIRDEDADLKSSPLSQPGELSATPVPGATPVPVTPLAVLTFQGPEILGRERFPQFSDFVSRKQAQLHWENGKFKITHLSQNVKTSVIDGRTGEIRTLERGQAETIELGDIIHLGVEFIRFTHGNGQYLLMPVESGEMPRLQQKPSVAPVGEVLVPHPIIAVGDAPQAASEKLPPGIGAERHPLPGGKGKREVVPMGTLAHEKVFVLGSFRGTEGDLPSNYYPIPAASVSRRHAEVRMKDGVLTVRDLGSHNGTWVWKAATGEYENAAEGPVRVEKGDFIFLAGADPESRVALSVDSQGRIYTHERLEEWGDLPRQEAPPLRVGPKESTPNIPLLPPGTHPSPDGSIELASLVPSGSGQIVTLYVETGNAKTDSLATPSILISVPNVTRGGTVPLISPPPIVYGELHATKQGWELQKKIGGRVVVTQGPAHSQEKPAEKNGRVRLADGDVVQLGRLKFRFEEQGAKLIPISALGETMPPMVRLNAAPMAAAAKGLQPSRRAEGEGEGNVIAIGEVSARADQPTPVRLAEGETSVFHLWQRNGKYYLQLTPEGRRQGLSLSNESGPMNIKAMSPTLIESGKISVQREGKETVTVELPRPKQALSAVPPSPSPQGPKHIEGPLPLLRDLEGKEVAMKPQSDGSLEIAKQVVIQQKGDGTWVLIDHRDPSQVQTPEESKASIRNVALVAYKLFPVQINERPVRPGEEIVLQGGESIVVIPSLMGKIQFPKPNLLEKGVSQWSPSDQARFYEGLGKSRTFKEVQDWVNWTRLPGAEAESAALDGCIRGAQTLDHLSPKVRERMIALMDYFTKEGQAFLPKGFSPLLERPMRDGLIPAETSYRATRAALQLSDRISQARTVDEVIQAIVETPLANPEGLNKKTLLDGLQKLKSGEGGTQEIPRGFGIRQKLRDIQEARMHRFHVGAEGIPVSVRDPSLQMEFQRLAASEHSLYGPTTQLYREGRVFQRSWKGLTHAQALEQIYLVLHRGHPVEKITSEHGVRQAVEYHMTQVIATAQRLYSKEWNQAQGRNLFTGEKIREGNLDSQYRFARMLINQKTGQPIFGMPTGAEVHTLLQFTSRLSGGKVQSYEEAQAVIRDHFTRFTSELQAHLSNQFMDSQTKALIIETFFGPYQHRQLDNPRQAFQLARFLGGVGFYREVGVTVDIESGGQVHTNLTLGDLGSVSPEDRHVYFVMHTHPELYENEQGGIMGQADPRRGDIAGTFVFGAGRKSVDTTNTVFSTQDVILFRQSAERIFRDAQSNPNADLSIFYDRARHVFRNWVQHPYGFAEVQIQLDPTTGRAKGVEIRYVAEDGRDPNKGHQYQANKLMDLTRQRFIKNDPKRGENPLYGLPITVRRVTDVNERWQMERAMPYPNPSQK